MGTDYLYTTIHEVTVRCMHGMMYDDVIGSGMFWTVIGSGMFWTVIV